MAICETCGVSFEPKPQKKGRFCSSGCYFTRRPDGPRKASVKGQRLLAAKGHPLTPPSGRVAESRLVLFDKIGPGPHTCHWCGDGVTWIVGGGPGTPGSLIADHLDWDKANNAPKNLVPSCNNCNKLRTRHGDRMLQPADVTVIWAGRPTKADERTCEHCGEKFLIPPSATRGGRGRFCSRSCARSRPRKR